MLHNINMSVIYKQETFFSRTYSNISISSGFFQTGILYYLFIGTMLNWTLITRVKVTWCEMIPVDGLLIFLGYLAKREQNTFLKLLKTKLQQHNKLYFLRISPISYLHFGVKDLKCTGLFKVLSLFQQVLSQALYDTCS